MLAANPNALLFGEDVAVKGGVDVGQAASATESVVTVATEATTPAPAPVPVEVTP